MGKEMTPLEALGRIIQYNDLRNPVRGQTDLIDIVENALKEYEKVMQTKFVVVDVKISDEVLEKLKNQRILVGNLEPCEIKPLFDEETQKKLKALEIIKEKQVDVSWFIECLSCKNPLEVYNDRYDKIRSLDGKDYRFMQLTEEEYDILKVVLTNGR